MQTFEFQKDNTHYRIRMDRIDGYSYTPSQGKREAEINVVFFGNENVTVYTGFMAECFNKALEEYFNKIEYGKEA